MLRLQRPSLAHGETLHFLNERPLKLKKFFLVEICSRRLERFFLGSLLLVFESLLFCCFERFQQTFGFPRHKSGHPCVWCEKHRVGVGKGWGEKMRSGFFADLSDANSSRNR